jgi:site-specific DNA-methyltransferase (adenine-specific)/adenine-specific DNA-methyltransferase
MPTLDWIGKAAVANHHQEVPTKLLHCDGSLSAGDPEAGNLLVEGDNLEALKALLPYYAGKVKCIYIDPPYNTGEQGWVYNDNVNSPEIRAWLNKTVGIEGEDFCRHDKWLCMMFPRLRLLRDFLEPDGIIFVSIDDGEVTNLRTLMDDLFGRSRFIGQFIWKSRQNKDNRSTTGASIDHEYVLAYGSAVRGDARNEAQYSNPDNDPRGPWASGNMVGIATASARPNLHYDLINPADGHNYGCPPMGWRFEPSRMATLIADGRILWPSSPTGRPRQKVFLSEFRSQFTGFSSIVGEGLFTRDGTREIDEHFGHRAFPFAKPSDLIRQLIVQGCPDGGLILDSFAGSGTTGEAVLRQSATDGKLRRFVLVEMDQPIAKDVTAQRLSKTIEDLGESGFRYCTLGKPLFDEWGCVTDGVTYGDLAAFIFFSDTGSPIPAKATGDTSFLGTFEGRAIHLLWSADSAGAANESAGNVLTAERLADLPKSSPDFDGPVTVYAEGCTVSAERLAAAQVSFRQIPYQVAGA